MKKRFLINMMIVAFIVLLVTAGVYLWWRWSQMLLAQKPYETEREEVAYYIERHYLLDDTIQAASLLQQYPTAEAMVQALQDP